MRSVAVSLACLLGVGCYRSHTLDDEVTPRGCVVEPVCHTGRACLAGPVEIPWDPSRPVDPEEPGIRANGPPGQVWAWLRAPFSPPRDRWVLIDLEAGQIVQEHVFPDAFIVGRPTAGPDGTLFLLRQSTGVGAPREYEILRLRPGLPDPDVLTSVIAPSPFSESHLAPVGWDDHESAVVTRWIGPDRDPLVSEYRWFDLEGRLLRRLPIADPDPELFFGPGAMVWTSNHNFWAWTRGDEAARLVDGARYPHTRRLAATDRGFVEVLVGRSTVRRLDEIGDLIDDEPVPIYADESASSSWLLASAGSHVLLRDILPSSERPRPFRMAWLDAEGRSIAVADHPGWFDVPRALWDGEAYVVQIAIGGLGDERMYVGRLGCQY